MEEKKETKIEEKEIKTEEKEIKTADNKNDISSLLSKIEALEKIIKQTINSRPQDSDKSLDEKIKAANIEKAQKISADKELEDALKFNLQSDKFLKENQSVLPSEVTEIFKQADKEKYESAIDRANATKAAILNTFFSQQANIDLLTDAQKESINNYFKLTKKAREEKSNEIFKNIFEPTVEMLKRIKKAEQIAKAAAGMAFGTDFEKAYADKMRKHSEKYYYRKGV